MKCFYREKRYVCGNYVDIDIYPVWVDSSKKGSRRKKEKVSSEVQQRLNKRNSERELIRLLNTNFTNNDLSLTLTYSPDNLPDSDEDALKEQRNFLRRLKRAYKKNSLELKYIAVTEKSKKGRYHHHLVISGGIHINQIAQIWGYGFIQAKPLQFNEFGIVGIAKYLIKEPVGAHRWSGSRNLKRPAEYKRDGKISKCKMRELYRCDLSMSDFVSKEYPSLSLADSGIVPVYNEINGGYYLSLCLYNSESVYKRRRKNE